MIVIKSTNKDTVPFFNAPIFLENKQQIGKVDEIFGPVKDYVRKKINFSQLIHIYKKLNKFNKQFFSVKLSEQVKASSFKKNDKVNLNLIINSMEKVLFLSETFSNNNFNTKNQTN